MMDSVGAANDSPRTTVTGPHAAAVALPEGGAGLLGHTSEEGVADMVAADDDAVPAAASTARGGGVPAAATRAATAPAPAAAAGGAAGRARAASSPEVVVMLEQDAADARAQALGPSKGSAKLRQSLKVRAL